jgi:prephenate dehydrogenase
VSEPHRQGATRVAILGTGLIGASVGMALRAAGPWAVTGWDPADSALRTAVERGAVDCAAESLADAARNADMVVLAAPVSCAESLVEQVASAAGPDAAVTDVGSTKARIVAAGERALGGRFVGGHPMAGSAWSGAGAASASLFRDSSWFLTPTPRTTGESLALVRRLAEDCGASVRECGPGEHDRLVGILSHLPHLLAYGLAQTAADAIPAEWRSVAAGSFRDGTRVAASSPRLWAGILLDNREEALRAMEAHGVWMERARQALESRDGEALLALLSDAHAAKERFPLERKGDE